MTQTIAADSIPIRIAWCECDSVIPFGRYGQPLVERIHGANVTVVRSAGHVPIYDDPEQVAANILGVTGARSMQRDRSPNEFCTRRISNFHQ
jgi:pimeloyl-ACP methyl ester carboxylesterase